MDTMDRPQRQKALPSALREIVDVVSRIEQLSGNLEESLVSCLRDPSPTPEEAKMNTADSAGCMYSRELVELRGRLDRVEWRLDDILARLEV